MRGLAGGGDPDRAADPGIAGQAVSAAVDASDSEANGQPAGQAAGAPRELSEAAGCAMTALAAGEPSAALAEAAAIRAAACACRKPIPPGDIRGGRRQRGHAAGPGNGPGR